MKRKLNFDILESLRGMAALYVCIGHSRANLWIGGEHYLQLHPRNTWGFSDYLLIGLNMLTRLSTEFVIVFFVLSGFSIAHSLRKHTEAVPFYKRRFIRLYPPYITALLWAMVVFLLIRAIAPQFTDGSYQTATLARLKDSRQLLNWKVVLQNLVYLPQLDGIIRPFWSLTMEVIFYLAAPFLFRNKKIYYSISILLFITWIGVQYSTWHPHSIIENYLFYNLFFATGVALYQYYDIVLQKAKFFLTSKALWIALGIYFTMIGISLVITRYEPITAFFAAFMSIILIVYLLSANKEIKWLIGIGRFSYTLYITHFPSVMLYMALYFLITNATPPYIYNSLVFIPCVFFCLGIAYLQYYFVERKSKQVLDRLREKDIARKEKNIYTESAAATKVEKTNW
jgi:peptidoglycan/LPS O-acetylase OafA/YrhL